MSKLWEKGEPLDEVIERFTVGRDPELDMLLVPYDALASAAHVRMLEKVGLMPAEEAAPVIDELRSIVVDARRGEFFIERSEEDCHTAIENRLTARLGAPGRRVHAGRSRNDQVIAALRLFARERILAIFGSSLDVAKSLGDLALEHRDVAIPGYTHTRQAMPSTLGLLFAAYAEALLDDLAWLRTAFHHANRSALGSASGFGVPLPLDRQFVADLLRCDSVQANTIAVQNDRGKTEHLVLTACSAPALDLARLANEIIWYSTEEFGFLRLSGEVTTGSSIMPQKRNPDALELVRATGARLRARTAEISAIYGPLVSGYHRDLQLTKEPFLSGLIGAHDVLVVMNRVLKSIEVNTERCRDALLPSIGSTDAMCQRIGSGQPMRDAYREVALDPEGALDGDPADAWRRRVHIGAPGALDDEQINRAHATGQSWLKRKIEMIDAAWMELLRDADDGM